MKKSCIFFFFFASLFFSGRLSADGKGEESNFNAGNSEVASVRISSCTISPPTGTATVVHGKKKTNSVSKYKQDQKQRTIVSASKKKKVNFFQKIFKPHKKRLVLTRGMIKDPFLDECLSDLLSACCQDMMDWACSDFFPSLFESDKGWIWFVVLVLVIIIVVALVVTIP
jgi:hypothetical protein